MGWLPVSRAALERAIELNGAAVPLNLRALQVGRAAACHRATGAIALLRASGMAESDLPAQSVETARVPPLGPQATLAQRIEVRATFLAGYQGQRLARRYRSFVESVAAREAAVVPGSTRLAEAVAQSWFRLLAVKDEYEVARLHSGMLESQVAATFEGDYRVSFHLAPPLFARKDPVTGLPRKREFGAWILPVFRVLAAMKFLRGTPLDPFGYTAERRGERLLQRDFAKGLEEALAVLSIGNHASVVDWVRAHDAIRGYGHVKAANLAKAKERLGELRGCWDNDQPANRAV